MNRTIIIVAVAGLFACGSSVASASPITFSFTGEVTQDPLLDPADPFGGTITLGAALTGSYTFESTTADSDPSINGGSYTSVGGTLSVSIGGTALLAADLLNVGLGNNFSGSDFYTVSSRNTSGPDPFDVTLTLQDLQGTVFSDALLSSDAPPFAAFELTSLLLMGTFGGNQVEIGGRLTSLTCTTGCGPAGAPGSAVVPEPSTVSLVSVGLAALRLRIRRRRAR